MPTRLVMVNIDEIDLSHPEQGLSYKRALSYLEKALSKGWSILTKSPEVVMDNGVRYYKVTWKTPSRKKKK